jgi:hypothetical protein
VPRWQLISAIILKPCRPNPSQHHGYIVSDKPVRKGAGFQAVFDIYIVKIIVVDVPFCGQR